MRTISKVMKHLYCHCKSWVKNRFPNETLKKNEKFKNLHQGERCFILGSGSSILKQDLTKLKDEIVITQNNFHAHHQIKEINPDYHVLIDKYQPNQYDDDWNEWLESMSQRLPSKTILFLGTDTKPLVDHSALFKERVYYLETGYQCALLKRAPVDLTKMLMAEPTVLPKCLAVAIYMGFKEIYLMGFDLDQAYHVGDPNAGRFYGSSPITANKAERDLVEEFDELGLMWLNMWLIWKQCYMLKREAEQRGLKIINATRGGILTMYERRPYEEVIAAFKSSKNAGDY